MTKLEIETERPTFQLGDMTVIGQWPGKMMRALAVIATNAHQAYEANAVGLPPGKSRELCLFMSLAVRDFLVQIGFEDATARGCMFYVAAHDHQGEQIWSLGIGAPGQPDIPDKFNGHAVCVVPSLSLLIDVTTYQAIRHHWRGALAGMIALPYEAPHPELLHGRHPFAVNGIALDDRDVVMLWLDRPELNWRNSEDFRVRNARRIAVTKAMLAAFQWRDE